MEFIPEYTKLSGIRPDAFITLQNSRRTYLYFAEIQISNNPLDVGKYEQAYITNKQARVFPEGVFPNILVVTDKKIPPGSRYLNIVVVDTGFKNINRLVI